jgi:hypothetical protein
MTDRPPQVADLGRPQPVTKGEQDHGRVTMAIHQGDPGMARPSIDHEHRGLHGLGAEPVQGFLAGLIKGPASGPVVPARVLHLLPHFLRVAHQEGSYLLD